MSGGDTAATLTPVPNGVEPLPGSAAAALKDALEPDAHAAAIQQQQQQQQQQDQPKQEERRQGQAEAGEQQGDAQNAGAAWVEASRHTPKTGVAQQATRHYAVGGWEVLQRGLFRSVHCHAGMHSRMRLPRGRARRSVAAPQSKFGPSFCLCRQKQVR